MHLVVPPGGSFRDTRRIELDERVLTIGRGEGCDVRVDIPGVDDEHAKISAMALVAIGNDCAIGDVPLDAGQRRLVSPGDEIQIGSVVLAVDGHDPGSERPAGPRIRVVEGQNFGAELVLTAENREYVIGRSQKADLVLEDREVSREHLKIVRRGFAVYIYDASSTRGSWLGRSAVYQGTKVEWERRRMLKVGATVLSLDLPEDARKAVPAAQASAPLAMPAKQKKPAAPESSPGVAPPPSSAGAPAVAEPEPTPGIVAYHYEAKPASVRTPVAPEVAVTTAGMGESKAPEVVLDMVSPTPAAAPSRVSMSADRTAWKKSGPTIGKTSGILLLALAGIAVLGVIFVVFTLIE